MDNERNGYQSSSKRHKLTNDEALSMEDDLEENSTTITESNTVELHIDKVIPRPSESIIPGGTDAAPSKQETVAPSSHVIEYKATGTVEHDSTFVNTFGTSSLAIVKSNAASLWRQSRNRTRNYRRGNFPISQSSDEEGDETEMTGLPEFSPQEMQSQLGEDMLPSVSEDENSNGGGALSLNPDSSASMDHESNETSHFQMFNFNVDDGDDEEENVPDDDDQASEATDAAAEGGSANDLINRPKPAYTWNSLYELRLREHGLARGGERSLRGGMSPDFNSRYYASRFVVERMKQSHCLRKHKGCVNCLNFNRSGDLLCTGSDDTRIIIWDWAHNRHKHVFQSGHTENIFQTKFLDSAGCLDIVSTSRDGQVRRSLIPPSGGNVQMKCLYKHNAAVHKIAITPRSSHELHSVGEDGYIRHKDIRTDNSSAEIVKLVTSARGRKVRLLSIAHHPYAPEICVCGSDCMVRIYDKRYFVQTANEMCPRALLDTSIPQVTCSVYNSTGSEVLASYSDDHIYLFDNKSYKTGEFMHCYKGHYNHKTIKGVNFFGPNSEYVISGSDCGQIFYWDKNSEAIMNCMPADSMGVVNCLEPHPYIPVLATSGLDHNIKIWTPSSDIYPPDLSKLEICIKRNLKRSAIHKSNEFDDRQFRYFIRQILRNPRSRGLNTDTDSDSDSNITDPQRWTSSSSSSSSSDAEYPQVAGVSCQAQ